MMNTTRRREFFEQVYDILIEHGKATVSMKVPFLHHHVDSPSPCEEWRFEGLLGFGGKYRSQYNRVDCYSEDLNTLRSEAITKINKLLVELKNKYRPTIYVDMDGVLADYDARKTVFGEESTNEKDFYYKLEPIEDAVIAFKTLARLNCNLYILSTAPWSNVHAWTEKRLWVEEHLGDDGFKRLILTHHKNLLKGDYLIDDRIANGVDGFEGKHIHFGSPEFPNWKSVVEYLYDQIKYEGVNN